MGDTIFVACGQWRFFLLMKVRDDAVLRLRRLFLLRIVRFNSKKINWVHFADTGNLDFPVFLLILLRLVLDDG
jgi:hypothetical protein